VNHRPLPNVFLVGAPRTGTTSLYTYLAGQPDVYMSPIKEPNYFARSLLTPEFVTHRRNPTFDLQGYLESPFRETVHLAYVTEWNDYVRLFDRVTSERVVGEASTFYLQCPASAAEIHASIPGARIIIGLRNPVERAYSEYLMNYGIGYLRGSLAEAVENEVRQDFPMGGLVAGSMYYQPVSRYLEMFGRDRVMIFLQEDMRDAAVFRRAVCEFLGIEHRAGAGSLERRNHFLYRSGVKSFISRVSPEKLRELGKKYYYSQWRIPKLTDQDRRLLGRIFKDDTVRLERLIGRDLSSWNAYPR
jgi:hypothetical protein